MENESQLNLRNSVNASENGNENNGKTSIYTLLYSPSTDQILN